MTKNTIFWFLRILSIILIIIFIISSSVSIYECNIPGSSMGTSGPIGPNNANPIVIKLATRGEVIEVKIQVGDIKNITNMSIFFDGKEIPLRIVNNTGIPLIDVVINTRTIGVHTIIIESMAKTWCDISIYWIGISTLYMTILSIYLAIGVALQIIVRILKKKGF